MSSKRVCACRWEGCDRDDLTPQGVRSHETHCDANPNPGVPFEKQRELGLLEGTEGATAPDGDPDPDQSVAEPPDGLPPVETLAPGKSPPKAESEPSRGPCDLCGCEDVLEASDARERYIASVARPDSRAVLAYELARWACQNPECAALWGGEFDEPVPMEVAIRA